jgi:hypothetical protein
MALRATPEEKAQTFRLSAEGLSRLEAWISPSCWFLAPSKNQQLAGGFRDNFEQGGRCEWVKFFESSDPA